MRTAHDEEARWLAYRRGDLRIAVNLGGQLTTIPLGGGRRRGGGDRVVAAWEPVEAPGADGLLRLPPESCVVLADG